jgi:hypothetical protein
MICRHPFAMVVWKEKIIPMVVWKEKIIPMVVH